MKWSLPTSLGLIAISASVTQAHAARSDPWTEQFGGTPDLSFSGITTFAHLPHERCLDNIDGPVDVAILGVPYDNAVSYRPGKSPLSSHLAQTSHSHFFVIRMTYGQFIAVGDLSALGMGMGTGM